MSARWAGWVLGCAALGCGAWGQEPLGVHPSGLAPVEDLAQLLGEDAAVNVSGAVVMPVGERRYMAVVSDEGTRFAMLRVPAHAAWSDVVFDVLELLPADSPLRASRPEEIDFEDVSCAPGRLYLAASASLKRRMPSKKKLEKNLARLTEVRPASGEDAPHSNYVFELAVALDAAGELSVTFARAHDLRAALTAIPALGPFTQAPSKDNGIDVEGFETIGPHHYVGLRGPVLRGHAVIVRTGLALEDPTPFFLDLDGLGVRSLRRHGDAIYVLAGPTMPLPLPHALFRWSGDAHAFRADEDARSESAALTRVGLVAPSAEGSKPEGLLIGSHPGRSGPQLIVIDDGPSGGAPRILELPAR